MAECNCLSHNGFLTVRGYAERAQREAAPIPELDFLADAGYIDKVVSVSASPEAGSLYAGVPDALIDQQYRRFLNGF